MARFLAILFFAVLCSCGSAASGSAENSALNVSPANGTSGNSEPNAGNFPTLEISVGRQTFYAKFEGNVSAKAFAGYLAGKSELALDMEDYGNFEKVAEIDTTLPRSDRQITAVPGDVILYLGNHVTIYYGTNSWNFTRLARIENANAAMLQKVLGEGNVQVLFRLRR